MNFDEQNIIKVLGIEALPDERKIAIVNKLTDLLQKRLILRMVAALDENDQEKLAEVMDGDDAEALNSFISAHFPDFESWIADETTKLKAELDGFANQLPT